MRRLAAASVLVLALVAGPEAAQAGERVTDGVLGALAGALVAGPIGLVAGGAIGYTTGPNISQGFSGSRGRVRHRARSRRRVR